MLRSEVDEGMVTARAVGWQYAGRTLRLLQPCGKPRFLVIRLLGFELAGAADQVRLHACGAQQLQTLAKWFLTGAHHHPAFWPGR